MIKDSIYFNLNFEFSRSERSGIIGSCDISYKFVFILILCFIVVPFLCNIQSKYNMYTVIYISQFNTLRY